MLDSNKQREDSMKVKFRAIEDEVTLLRKCKQDHDQREEQLFQHTKHLCDLVEAQRSGLKEKDKLIKDLKLKLNSSTTSQEFEKRNRSLVF